MPRHPGLQAASMLVVLLCLGGCTTHVRSTGAYLPATSGGTAALPRPDRVVVENFAEDGSAVRLDSGIRARLQREAAGSDAAEQRYRTGQEVQDAIADTLVDELRRMGFDAVRGEAASGPGPVLVIRGAITEINEGNQTRRNAIGFGAGKSSVAADVQVWYAAAAGSPPMLIQTYHASSDSGRKPGLATGLGAGAAAGHIATSAALAGAGAIHSSRHPNGVAAEGEHLAQGVASDLGALFARQGWTAPGANPAVSLR